MEQLCTRKTPPLNEFLLTEVYTIELRKIVDCSGKRTPSFNRVVLSEIYSADLHKIVDLMLILKSCLSEW